MKPTVVVLDEAEEELSEAHRYYEEQCPGLGAELRLAVDETITRIAEGSVVSVSVPGVDDPAIRRVLVKRFPYAVVFTQQERAVWIVAFAHARRRPGYWRDRRLST